jgi:plasmid stabilization system protein ParE
MADLMINPLVADDLKEIKGFIAEDNPEAALKTVQEIYDRFENIQQFPTIGADLSRRVRIRTDLKYIIWENYIILYRTRANQNCVEIYRVLNRFQDITKIFD